MAAAWAARLKREGGSAREIQLRSVGRDLGERTGERYACHGACARIGRGPDGRGGMCAKTIRVADVGGAPGGLMGGAYGGCTGSMSSSSSSCEGGEGGGSGGRQPRVHMTYGAHEAMHSGPSSTSSQFCLSHGRGKATKQRSHSKRLLQNSGISQHRSHTS